MCFSLLGRYGDVSTGRFRDHCHEGMIENLRQLGGAMEREMRVLKGKKWAYSCKRKENTPYTNEDITD